MLSIVVNNGQRYGSSMIKSFRDRGTVRDNDAERLFKRNPIKRLPARLQRSGLRKLLVLDAAGQLSDLKLPPGNKIEKLKGDRSGQHSIGINDQWRICFRWRDGDAYDVEITGYH
jgi:proteic killer suppression protein